MLIMRYPKIPLDILKTEIEMNKCTTKEMAERWKLSVSQVNKLRRHTNIPARKKITKEQVEFWLKRDDVTIREICDSIGISKPTWYSYVRRFTKLGKIDMLDVK